MHGRTLANAPRVLRRRFHRPLLAACLALTVCCSAAASLREDVQRLVRNAPLKGATVAVSVRDTGTDGSALVSINDMLPMVPASNMKLLTTGAALHVLGPEFAFQTRLVRCGERLIVIGDGDPAFADPELLAQMKDEQGQGLDVEGFLDLWVKAVMQDGMTKVSEVTVDDRVFDREFTHGTWPADQLNRRYCAQVAGFNFHANVLHFYLRPRHNQPPIITDFRPQASWLKLSNAADSRDGVNDRNDAWIARKLGTNELTVRGNVRFMYKTPIAVTVHDMPAFFAQLLAERLAQAGVRAGGYRVAAAGELPSVGRTIGPVITTPLATILTRCNQESENLYAECLLKRLGHAATAQPGSWFNGAAIVRHVVHERLDDPALVSGLFVADGSGLSQDNRITAAVMTAWLNSFHSDQRLGPAFLSSLAVAAESGTLEKRFGKTKLHGAIVQGKTGYINQVSCLSGYVTMPDGRRRSFSILVNGLKDPSTVPVAKALQDQIVGAIAQEMASAEVVLGGN